jgi:hypothetical protein
MDVQFSWAVNKPGELSGKVFIPALANVRDYFTATAPGKTAVYVMRNGVPVWGGIIWKRSFGSSGRELQIEADTWDSYMFHRIQDNDWMFLRDMSSSDPEKQREGVEQIEVFRHLWRYMCSEEGSDIGVVLGQQSSPVKRGVYFQKWDFETYGETLEKFAKLSNGFEWMATVGRSSDGKIERRIEFAYPGFGRPFSESKIIWEYPGSVTKYSVTHDSDKAATMMYVTGKGDGDLMTYSKQHNQEAIDNGYPRLDEKESHKTVFDKTILDSHGKKYLRARLPPIPDIDIDIQPVMAKDLGEYLVGDEVLLVVNDELFAAAGVAPEDLLLRIDELSVRPNDAGQEEITPKLSVVARTLEIVDQEELDGDLVASGWTGPTVDAPDVAPPLTPEDDGVEEGRAAPWSRGIFSEARSTDPVKMWIGAQP